MIEGRDIRAARNRAGLTQQELATRLEVTLRTVGNWERGETVPRAKESAIRAALGQWMTGVDSDDAPTLRQASDAELLGEIARRFTRTPAERNREVHGTPAPAIEVLPAARKSPQTPGNSDVEAASRDAEQTQDPGGIEPS